MLTLVEKCGTKFSYKYHEELVGLETDSIDGIPGTDEEDFVTHTAKLDYGFAITAFFLRRIVELCSPIFHVYISKRLVKTTNQRKATFDENNKSRKKGISKQPSTDTVCTNY
ncbi:Oidioi.mRNA.OKI2018_I69.XSR.g14891.t1.cds [Oikopleura dioica]|uniref:Oidioi.mRNA.OKI2018_I69.XSR.g14891.t1.cds n=1 Tax=Oikopleura dioica TaxID=34765 RepID=A0ABN7SG59_OIKDI|nr:Oidioi.mRNA.OKI2018_I69.XSR.g14891.t1.cds [Oikopleura dioica]